MLDYARQRARDTLKAARTAILVTIGPADVQISEVECQAADLNLYLLVPGTSDHLFNLEHGSPVRLLATDWQLRGEAAIVPKEGPHLELELLRRAGATWCVLVRVDPGQIQLRRQGGWGNLETIDLKPA